MEHVVFANRFLAVIDRDGYTYIHEVRCGGQIISILPFRLTTHGRSYLARRETCPAHEALNEQPELCSITGGVDAPHTPADTAQIELLEEAGYSISSDELIPLGWVKPSKAMDTVAHLFAVDVTSKTPNAAVGDGTKWEAGASVEWVSEKLGLDIGDPLFVVALARLKRLRAVRAHS